MTTNKQEIQKRLDEVKLQISNIEKVIEEMHRIEDELLDLTLEESQLELAITKLEEIEEQHEENPTSRFANTFRENDERPLHQIKNEDYPSTDQKYGDFTGVTNEDR